MEKKIKEILIQNNDCIEIRNIGLYFDRDDVIEDIELNHEDEEDA